MEEQVAGPGVWVGGVNHTPGPATCSSMDHASYLNLQIFGACLKGQFF